MACGEAAGGEGLWPPPPARTGDDNRFMDASGDPIHNPGSRVLVTRVLTDPLLTTPSPGNLPISLLSPLTRQANAAL
jgi:hypothetical protein